MSKQYTTDEMNNMDTKTHADHSTPAGADKNAE